MARLEYLSRHLGWRLLLLLFWTVLVCCILYASKGSSLSTTAPNNYLSHGFSAGRSRRVAGNSSLLPPGQCKVLAPGPEDLNTLRRLVHRGGHASEGGSTMTNPTVHCSVVSTCHRDAPFRARCFSSGCRSYTVRTKGADRHATVLSSGALPGFLESSLQENSFTTVDDLGRRLDLHCKDPPRAQVKVTGEVLASPRCQGKVERDDVSDNGSSARTDRSKISILYFRFLSQWELPVRFPGLFAFISRSVKDEKVSVLQFEKYQATEWADHDPLSVLLQGEVGPFIFNDSLLDTLRSNGYCLTLEDLTCGRSHQQDVLLRNVSSFDQLLCGQPSPQTADIMNTVCTEDNATDSQTRALLTSLLSHVHDVEGKNPDPRRTFSISVLNSKDFRNSHFVDQVLMNVVASLVGQEGRTVVLVSDVGNPTLLRFDLSVHLQAQASNPVLLLLSPAGLSPDTARLTAHLQTRPFSMLQLHHLLKGLVQKEAESGESPDKDLLESYDTEDLDSCGGVNVKPPFMCLCEGQLVTYDNDTLMAAFAELAVSMINRQLQHVHLDYFNPQRSRCARLSGMSFTNVQVGFQGNRKRILMDIDLENELFRDRVIRRVLLEMWASDKIPQAAVQVFKADPSSTLSSLTDPGDGILKTLCQAGDSLDRPISSEAGLLKRWSQQRHFGRPGRVTHVHDNCLYLLVRDFGDGLSVEAANVCADRQYDVVLHLSLMNMMSLTALPLSAHLGHVDRQVVAVAVKVAYTVPTFAYKLHPDFHVSYDD